MSWSPHFPDWSQLSDPLASPDPASGWLLFHLLSLQISPSLTDFFSLTFHVLVLCVSLSLALYLIYFPFCLAFHLLSFTLILLYFSFTFSNFFCAVVLSTPLQSTVSPSMALSLFFFKSYYILIDGLIDWLIDLAVPGPGCGPGASIFVAGWGIFQLQHVGSSSLIRYPSWAPCIGNVESWSLDQQGSLPFLIACTGTEIFVHVHTIHLMRIHTFSSFFSLLSLFLSPCPLFPGLSSVPASSSFFFYPPFLSFSSPILFLSAAWTSQLYHVGRSLPVWYFILGASALTIPLKN